MSKNAFFLDFLLLDFQLNLFYFVEVIKVRRIRNRQILGKILENVYNTHNYE